MVRGLCGIPADFNDFPFLPSMAPAMAPPAINAYDTDDEGPHLEPNPAKKARANMERSYVPAESADLVQISGQASGCKRFCSLQVSMHGCPDSVQPDIGSERS